MTQTQRALRRVERARAILWELPAVEEVDGLPRPVMDKLGDLFTKPDRALEQLEAELQRLDEIYCDLCGSWVFDEPHASGYCSRATPDDDLYEMFKDEAARDPGGVPLDSIIEGGEE
jgi:hypothetical protein